MVPHEVYVNPSIYLKARLAATLRIPAILAHVNNLKTLQKLFVVNRAISIPVEGLSQCFNLLRRQRRIQQSINCPQSCLELLRTIGERTSGQAVKRSSGQAGKADKGELK